MRRISRVALVSLLVVGANVTPAASAVVCPGLAHDDGPVPISRTDHQPSGNRVVRSCGLASERGFVDIDLGSTPTWVVADPSAPGFAWLVALEDGSIVRAVRDGDRGWGLGASAVARLRPAEPPLVSQVGPDTVAIRGGLDASDWFEDAIPGARVVAADDLMVALTGATDRYPHGVLGDGLEATALSLRSDAGEVTRIEVGQTAVIEGLSPIAADLDGDGTVELVVTVSDMYEGARLAVYALDGERIATSQAIGQGFRWLHQIGVGATGPGGEIEIIAVRTPHIGGVAEAYRLVDGRLERVATRGGYSSHQLGSANLDMALLADTDADGRLDLIVPTQDMATLAVLARRDDGFVLLDGLELDGRLASNVAAAVDDDGALVLAAGIDDGRLRVFR